MAAAFGSSHWRRRGSGVGLESPFPSSSTWRLRLSGHVENLLAERHVDRASAVLARVQPLVVGITGSHGKTTTKGYVAHLVGADRSVVASPRSFNNRAGLARTVNEHLAPGVEVLVAEMGAYGPGEIAALCSWLRPEVAVITAIGPSHLERFGSLDRTLSAKAEIAVGARVVVLNIDDHLLEALAQSLAVEPEGGSGLGVKRRRGCGRARARRRCGASTRRKVEGRRRSRAGLAHLRSRRTRLARLRWRSSSASIPRRFVSRLADLPSAPNRLQRYEAEAGYVVLDDTFNANPAGARWRSTRSSRETSAGRRVLVTPGMVELGSTQRAENAAFAEQATGVATDVVVVGRTNRAALIEGCQRAARPPSDEARQHSRGSRRVGARRISAPETPCCSRTTCRTISLELKARRVAAP